MQWLRKKSMWILLGLTVFVLAGCGTSAASNLNPTTNDRVGIWNQFIGFVSDAIDYFAHLTHDYGLAIIIVTLIVRLITLPFMLKQLKYTKTMQKMQPELKKIRELHQGDQQKINQESMKVMQQFGANPLTGCLPIIIQMPILLALYRAIAANVGIQHAHFFGIIALGKPDPYYILPILAAATTYVQSKMMAFGNDSQQRMMLLVMPIMILVLAIRFPAALALYWVFGNLFTIVQTYFTRTLPETTNATAGGEGT